MKLPSFIAFFGVKKSSPTFSEFFLRASDKEKRDVLMKAAVGANKDQRELFDRAKLKSAR